MQWDVGHAGLPLYLLAPPSKVSRTPLAIVFRKERATPTAVPRGFGFSCRSSSAHPRWASHVSLPVSGARYLSRSETCYVSLLSSRCPPCVDLSIDGLRCGWVGFLPAGAD